jgi:hypothetical protein
VLQAQRAVGLDSQCSTLHLQAGDTCCIKLVLQFQRLRCMTDAIERNFLRSCRQVRRDCGGRRHAGADDGMVYQACHALTRHDRRHGKPIEISRHGVAHGLVPSLRWRPDAARSDETKFGQQVHTRSVAEPSSRFNAWRLHKTGETSILAVVQSYTFLNTVPLLMRRFRSASSMRRGLVIEALLLLLWAKVSLKVIPFGRLSRRFGDFVPPDSPRLAAFDELDAASGIASEVCWAIRCVARRAPFKAVCLPQAIAAHAMLARRGIPSAMHFGAAQSSDKPIDAHVWLNAAGVEVTGYPVSSFREIGCFIPAQGTERRAETI